jgi:CTLH/CRA C-terminal to LisH motif domain
MEDARQQPPATHHQGWQATVRGVHLWSQSQELVDAHIFEEAQKVLDALRAHDCGPALAWCSQHAGKLRKIRSHSLEFKLRLQVHPGHALL